MAALTSVSGVPRKSPSARIGRPTGSRALSWCLTLVLTVNFTVSATASEGFYVPRSIGALMAEADWVVAGAIAEVQKDRFRFTVERVVAGDGVEGAVWVEPFEAPDTNPRWVPYEAGQRLVLFLVRSPVADCHRGAGESAARWRIPGVVGEGEISLDGPWAYFHGRNIPVLDRDTFDLSGHSVHIQRFDSSLTLDALSGLAACIDRGGSVDREERTEEPGKPRRLCSESEWTKYRRRSILHEYLAEESSLPLL